MKIIRKYFMDFKTVSSFVAIILFFVLDCNIMIKIVVASAIVMLYFIALAWQWSKEKWIVAVILCISSANIYYHLTEYLHYWIHYSASYNEQCGFSTSQVAYLYNSGNSDAALCGILREKVISVYGNCEMYDTYLEIYSKKVLTFDENRNVDFLGDKQDEFLAMGKMSICTAMDCFSDEEVEKLTDIRNDIQPLLYLSSDKVAEEDECIVAIDSSHNIYVMTKDEWENTNNG